MQKGSKLLEIILYCYIGFMVFAMICCMLMPSTWCSLCGTYNERSPYPCLVSLESGHTTEIRLTEIDLDTLEETEQFRTTGIYTRSFFVGNCFATSSTNGKRSVTVVRIPDTAGNMHRYDFCRRCRANIRAAMEADGISSMGYVLADLHNPEDIRLYPIRDGAEYDIQGCTVRVAWAIDGLTVTVTKYLE